MTALCSSRKSLIDNIDNILNKITFYFPLGFRNILHHSGLLGCSMNIILPLTLSPVYFGNKLKLKSVKTSACFVQKRVNQPQQKSNKHKVFFVKLNGLKFHTEVFIWSIVSLQQCVRKSRAAVP